jgi:predicted ATP-dependent endonuclease of OLD family
VIITNVKLVNWKNFKSVDVQLRERMFVVGANASGKSNFFDVFRFLFDRGFISFEDNGELMISDVAHKESVQRMGVDTKRLVRVGEFSEGKRFFLAHHRRYAFLQVSAA